MSDEPNEETVWKDRPSQIINIWHYLAAGAVAIALAVLASAVSGYLAIGIILPAGFALWKFLVVRCRIYELTTQRLRLYTGVLNQHIDEIELYRVKDTRILRPFWLRLFSLGNISLETSDRTHPRPELLAIKDAMKVREDLRRQVELLRDQKRVREVDFDETGDSEFGDELG